MMKQKTKNERKKKKWRVGTSRHSCKGMVGTSWHSCSIQSLKLMVLEAFKARNTSIYYGRRQSLTHLGGLGSKQQGKDHRTPLLGFESKQSKGILQPGGKIKEGTENDVVLI